MNLVSQTERDNDLQSIIDTSGHHKYSEPIEVVTQAALKTRV